jgi:hypothetical protein
VIDNELAWELVDIARGHLAKTERDKVYIAIAAGDAFWAVRFLLRRVVESELTVRSDQVAKLLRWVTAYHHHPDAATLRFLVGRMTVRPCEPSRDVHPPPRFLATKARWKGHSGTHLAPRGLIAKVRDLDSALRRWDLSAELTGIDWQEG